MGGGLPTRGTIGKHLSISRICGRCVQLVDRLRILLLQAPGCFWLMGPQESLFNIDSALLGYLLIGGREPHGILYLVSSVLCPCAFAATVHTPHKAGVPCFD